jgi:hypothetical protein
MFLTTLSVRQHELTCGERESMFDALGAGDARMPDPDSTQPPLGQLLVERGLLTEEQLQYALAEHDRSGLPLGQVLISLSYVTASTIAQALATRQGGGVAKTEFGMATGFGTPGVLSIPPVSPPAAVSKASWIAEAPEAEVIPLLQPEPVVVAAPPVPDAELETARSRIAELEMELATAVSANTGRIEELERELANARMDLGRIPALEVDLAAARQAEGQRDALAHELELTRNQLVSATDSLTSVWERLQQYEAAWAAQQAEQPQQPRTVSPYAWQS